MEGVETNHTFHFGSAWFRIVKCFLPQISQHPCRASALRLKRRRWSSGGVREVGTGVQVVMGKGFQPFLPSYFNLEVLCLHAHFLCITAEQLKKVHKAAPWRSCGRVRQLGGKQVCWALACVVDGQPTQTGLELILHLLDCPIPQLSAHPSVCYLIEKLIN